MSETVSGGKKLLPVRRLLLIALAVVFLFLVALAGALWSKGVNGLSSEISAMKQQIASLNAQVQQDRKGEVQSQLIGVQQQLSSLKLEIDAVKKLAVGAHQTEIASLVSQVTHHQQSIDAMNAGIRAQLARLEALEQGIKTRAAEKALDAVQGNSPQKPPVRRSRVTASRPAPFVVTGVERRGDTTFVAILPKGAQTLDAVRLMAPGDVIAGWQYESAYDTQAIFRVAGRTQRLSVQ